MEKSVKRVDSGAVQVRSRCIETEIETSGPDEARRTAGRQARHRVHLAGLNPMLVSGLHPMLRQRDPAARLIV